MITPLYIYIYSVAFSLFPSIYIFLSFPYGPKDRGPKRASPANVAMGYLYALSPVLSVSFLLLR